MSRDFQSPASQSPASQSSPSQDPASRKPVPGGGRTAFVVPHTHWDREWYRPFQSFRVRLVEVIDRVLELLENDPDYRRFTLDGQAVILEDYLAVRPEAEARLRAQVQAGRLRIGPWYVLADEFLVSPESLVRNLLLGREACERFGEPMPVCYTPDSFGHISQLPLLAAEFGHKAVVFERGVGDEGEELRGEFAWKAADGRTVVQAAHLLGTYSAATALGHRDWELGDALDAAQLHAHLDMLLYGRGDGADLPPWFREALQRVPGGVAAYAVGGPLLLLNGSDHLFPQADLPAALEHARRMFPEVEFVHADVEEFVDAAARPLETLACHQGEFRGSRYQHVLSGVLSARLYLKRANHAAETLLERYAEPLSALAWLHGRRYPRALLRTGWKLLLENHPHDSICGCSVDAVHREMMTRFAGVTQLGDELCAAALASLSAAPAAPAVVAGGSPDAAEEGLGTLAVFNPLPERRRALVRATVELPAGAGEALEVVDAGGASLPLAREVRSVMAPGRSDERRDRVELQVLAELPPLGTSTLHLRRAPAPPSDAPGDAPSGGDALSETAGVRGWRRDGRAGLANAHLEVHLGAEGALELREVASGRSHPLQLWLEDVGDAGDEYDFSPVPGDAPRRFGTPERVALTAEGPLRAALCLEYALPIPQRLTDKRDRREGEVTLPLSLTLQLDAEARTLELGVEFDNRAEDHRLRLLIATPHAADTLRVGGHFDVLERPLRPAAGDAWFQKPQGTNHQRDFVALADADSDAGLALFAPGLPEYEAWPSKLGDGAEDAPDGAVLAVTLLRSVGWLSRDDLLSRPQGAGPALPTPEAQCLGPQRMRLGLHPFGGPWRDAGVPQEAQRFVGEPLALPLPALPPGDVAEREGVALEGPLLLSSCKRCEARESLLLRLWNPLDEPATGVLQLPRAPREGFRASLAEGRLEPLTDLGRRLTLHLGAKEVRTLELCFEEAPAGGGTTP